MSFFSIVAGRVFSWLTVSAWIAFNDNPSRTDIAMIRTKKPGAADSPASLNDAGQHPQRLVDKSVVPENLNSRRAIRYSFKRTIRRPELRQIVPLADTTIYEMEQRGEFPRRFYLTSRCVVWDLAEVEAWIEERRRASDASLIKRAPSPDVRQRKTRPVRP
jgi:prophage regulatory protein